MKEPPSPLSADVINGSPLIENINVKVAKRTDLAKSWRTTHMMMNIRTRAPMMAKRAGS